MLPIVTRRGGRSLLNRPFGLLDEDWDRVFNVKWPATTDDLVAQYPVDIHEDDAGIHVEAELPGFTKDEVDVTLENGVLTITAERTADQTKGEKHLNERRFTKVSRSFTLPNTVDAQNVEATLNDGVLKLLLHKHEAVKPKRIKVS